MNYQFLVTTFSRPNRVVDIANQASLTSHQPEIVISVHDPDIDSRTFESLNARVLATSTKRPAGQRWHCIEGDLPDRLIVVDDDTILEAAQIDALFTSLDNNPDQPHGVLGSSYLSTPYYRPIDGTSLNEYHERCSRDVDSLHQVYAVTGDHVLRFREIEDCLSGYDHTDPSAVGDDLIISLSGAGPARIHDLGQINECPSSWDPKTALNGRADFNFRRAMLLLELERLGVRPVPRRP